MKAILALIGSMALCLATVVIPAAPAPAATATIAVTPATGLVDQQAVTLAGAGFAPSRTVFFCQGRDVVNPTPADCDPSFGTVVTDPSGAFSATFNVRRFMTTTSAGAIDCAQPGAACAILGTDDLNGAGSVSRTPITFTQQPPLTYSIHGVVTNGDTQQPLPGVKVWVYAPSDGYVGSLQTTTGADGSYVISNPLPGIGYKMLFISPDPNLASAWFANTNSRANANPVVLRAPDQSNVQIDALLFATASVSGTVTDGSGQPVAGAFVGLYTTGDTWLPTYSTTTGAGGTYTFGAVKQASYRVLFKAPSGSGLAPQWYDHVSTRSQATELGINSGTQITGVDARLTPSA